MRQIVENDNVLVTTNTFNKMTDLFHGFCENCIAAKRELDDLKTDKECSLKNLHMLKSKVVATDLLIKDFAAKSRELDSCVKKKKELSTLVEQINVECRNKTEELSIALRDREVLHKANENLAEENMKCAERISKLENDMLAAKTMEDQYKERLKQMESEEDAKDRSLEQLRKQLQVAKKDATAATKSAEELKKSLHEKKAEDKILQKKSASCKVHVLQFGRILKNNGLLTGKPLMVYQRYVESRDSSSAEECQDSEYDADGEKLEQLLLAESGNDGRSKADAETQTIPGSTEAKFDCDLEMDILLGLIRSMAVFPRNFRPISPLPPSPVRRPKKLRKHSRSPLLKSPIATDKTVAEVKEVSETSLQSINSQKAIDICDPLLPEKDTYSHPLTLDVVLETDIAVLKGALGGEHVIESDNNNEDIYAADLEDALVGSPSKETVIVKSPCKVADVIDSPSEVALLVQDAILNPSINLASAEETAVSLISPEIFQSDQVADAVHDNSSNNTSVRENGTIVSNPEVSAMEVHIKASDFEAKESDLLKDSPVEEGPASAIDPNTASVAPSGTETDLLYPKMITCLDREANAVTNESNSTLDLLIEGSNSPNVDPKANEDVNAIDTVTNAPIDEPHLQDVSPKVVPSNQDESKIPSDSHVVSHSPSKGTGVLIISPKYVVLQEQEAAKADVEVAISQSAEHLSNETSSGMIHEVIDRAGKVVPPVATEEMDQSTNLKAISPQGYVNSSEEVMKEVGFNPITICDASDQDRVLSTETDEGDHQTNKADHPTEERCEPLLIDLPPTCVRQKVAELHHSNQIKSPQTDNLLVAPLSPIHKEDAKTSQVSGDRPFANKKTCAVSFLKAGRVSKQKLPTQISVSLRVPFAKLGKTARESGFPEIYSNPEISLTLGDEVTLIKGRLKRKTALECRRKTKKSKVNVTEPQNEKDVEIMSEENCEEELLRVSEFRVPSPISPLRKTPPKLHSKDTKAKVTKPRPRNKSANATSTCDGLAAKLPKASRLNQTRFKPPTKRKLLQLKTAVVDIESSKTPPNIDIGVNNPSTQSDTQGSQTPPVSPRLSPKQPIDSPKMQQQIMPQVPAAEIEVDLPDPAKEDRVVLEFAEEVRAETANPLALWSRLDNIYLESSETDSAETEIGKKDAWNLVAKMKKAPAIGKDYLWENIRLRFEHESFSGSVRQVARCAVGLLLSSKDGCDASDSKDVSQGGVVPVMRRENRILRLMDTLLGSRKGAEFHLEVLRNIWCTIVSSTKLQLLDMVALCRVFVHLCRQKNDRQRVRVLCHDLMYSFPEMGISTIANVVIAWPEAFTASRDGESPLRKVIAWVLVSKSGPYQLDAAVKTKVQEIIGPVGENLEQLTKELVQITADKSTETCVRWEGAQALQVLAVHTGWQWTNDALVREHLWPILQCWAQANAAQNQKPDDIVAANVIYLIGCLTRLCPAEDNRPATEVIKTMNALLSQSSTIKVADCVQEAAVLALLILKPFDDMATRALKDWWEKAPRCRSLSESTLKLLQSANVT